MNTSELKEVNPVRWDTFTNKIYFDLDKGSVRGRLIIMRDADGKIDMSLVKEGPVSLRKAP